MTELSVRAFVDAAERPDASLSKIVSAALEARGSGRALARPELSTLWPPESYGLERVTAFRERSRDVQKAILVRCATDRLHEAWFVEQLGLAFCAKMALLASDREERMLYALMGGEEASHFSMISALVEPPETITLFAALLGEVVESAQRGSLLVLVQLVLEGWGIQHYSRLARDCSDDDARGTFTSILRDEARHHGSAVVLLRSVVLSGDERSEVEGLLGRLLDMVRCGPQSILAALSPESRVEAMTMLEELGAGDTAANLAALRDLIGRAHVPELVNALDARGAFQAMTVEQQVAAHRAEWM